MSDVPQPGLVEIEVLDADGRVHRLTEKCSVVDADGRLHASSPYPLELEIACRPHHDFRPVDRSSRPCVDLTPWGVGDASELFTVERARLTWRRPAIYSDLSVAARQAVALVTFRRWRRRVGLDAVELDALDAHLWAYATVGPGTFDSWHEADPLTRLGGGDPLPDEISLAARSCGVDLPSFRRALGSLIEITYGGLFGRIESSWSLRELQTVGQFTSRDGVPLVAPDGFIDSLWVDNAWGSPSTAQVARWRSSN